MYRCPECDRKACRRAILAEEEKLQAQAQRKADRDSEFFRKLSIDVPHVSEMAESLVKRFGGLEAFVDFFHTQTLIAAMRNPGGANVLNACHKVMKVIEASTEHRETAPDMAGASDGDLERLMQEILKRAKVVDGKVIDVKAIACEPSSNSEHSEPGHEGPPAA